ncbi:unnamed protein product, partial [Medioppia subpectinata]
MSKIGFNLFLLLLIQCRLVANQCIYRGKCGELISKNEQTKGQIFPIPCVVDAQPQPLNQTNVDELKKIVPELFTGFMSLLVAENVLTTILTTMFFPALSSLYPLKDPNPVFCCDDDQAYAMLHDQIAKAEFISRCPSCYVNFAKTLIHMSCSPRHREFLKVTKSEKLKDSDKYMLKELSYYMTNRYANSFYNSCSSVAFPSGSSTVMKLLCGTYGAEHCSAARLLETMGHFDPSPMQINFKLTDAAIDDRKPMDDTTYSCAEAPKAYSTMACSCGDCPVICPVGGQLAYAEPDSVWQVWGVNGMWVCMAFVYLVLFMVIVIGFVICYRRKRARGHKSSEDNTSNAQKTSSFGQNVHEFGLQFDDTIREWFGRYGRFCSRRPWNVILPLVGVAAAVGLSVGILTSFVAMIDPVQLWSAPTSRARSEKDFFDNSFGPFYRTAQIIIWPNNKTTFEHFYLEDETTNSTKTIGPVFEKQFLLQVLELQSKVLNLTANVADKEVVLSDICFDPMKNKKCATQTPLGWFQNDINILNKTRIDEDLNNHEYNYLDHFISCTANPTSQYDNYIETTCAGTFGGPMFPNVALGDTDEDMPEPDRFMTARSLVITILINNNVDDDNKTDAMAWEKVFLDYMHSYSNPNFTFVFFAERSLQDEIDRLSKSSIGTLAISYIVMFIYISITLG